MYETENLVVPLCLLVTLVLASLLAVGMAGKQNLTCL